MKTLKTRKGFTLIEIVTVIVVLGILGAFSVTFIDNAIKTYMIAKQQRMIYQEASCIMERITRELRDGNYIWNFGTFIYFQKAHTTSIDSSKHIYFYLSSGNLYRASSTSFFSGFTSNQLFASNVTSFNISQNGDVFTITIVFTKDSQSVSLNTMVCPKNYCAGGPSEPSCTASYVGRSFNWDYEDVIQ